MAEPCRYHVRVSYPSPFGPRTERERRVVDMARLAAKVAAEHAPGHDRDATFPIEGLEALARSGYLALVVPEQLGGSGASVTEVALGNLELAKGDASLALVVAMHGAFLGRVRDSGLWPASRFDAIARDVVAVRDSGGALINSLATEPEMGSPSRGGLPATRAEPTPDGWLLNGRKSFSSGSPVLRWGVVSATVDSGDGPHVSSFLVPLAAAGVSVEPTWDTLGMRATGSHTLVFENVRLPADAELPRAKTIATGPPYERAWALTVSAVYLGVAEAARDEALTFARGRRPTALGGKSIAGLAHIRQRAGRIDLLLYEARALLIGSSRAWDEAQSDDDRIAMDSSLSAAKMVATNSAVSVAEEAMRLIGGSSMSRSMSIERHFRDVRGGLHHPPQDDATIEQLARDAFD